MGIFSRKKTTEPQAVTKPNNLPESSEIVLKIHQEFQDRGRKTIQGWRKTITAAENPEDPRWFALQDMTDDLVLDAHLSSVIDVRKSATLNHRSYVIDRKSGEVLTEQSEMLEKSWFYDFIDAVLDAIFKKYTVCEFIVQGEQIGFSVIPRRNCCPQLNRIYYEVSGNQFLDYSQEPDVIEIVHSGSKFGLINTVAPNVLWKRNAMQSYAEFTERFGMPLITATTSRTKDISSIEKGLKNLGEAGTGVLPAGSDIKVHALANAGNPEKTYVENAKLQDNQVSKAIIGSTTMVDEGANRAQTEVHATNLDDKIAASDRRTVMFVVNDKLFPLLQRYGFPFDNTTMKFQFDENEDLSLSEQWKITEGALTHYELDENVVKKTFNLPIKGLKQKPEQSFNNAAAEIRAIAAARNIDLPDYSSDKHISPYASDSISKKLLDSFETFDKKIREAIWNENLKEAEKNRLKKAQLQASELRNDLFNSWGKRRIETKWNAPDHRTLSAMEMNLFRFSDAKSKSEVFLLNQLLIDKDKLQIRSETDFIEQALKINTTYNVRYLSVERDFCIATSQTSARWCEFIGEKNLIPNWRYQTAGDDEVRPEHALLDGLIFSFDDVEARKMWPPNGFKCRCEGIQEAAIKPTISSGKDFLPRVFTNDKQRKYFALNRAESGVIFNQNQMYLNELDNNDLNINDYSYSDYDLQEWSSIKKNLNKIDLDKSITPSNVKELFKNNAGNDQNKAMGYSDYLKRKLILKEKTFEIHTKGKYITDSENRHQLFSKIDNVLSNPDEVYLRTYSRSNKEQLRYVKMYQDDLMIVDCEVTNDGLEIKTWYSNKDNENKTRTGLLIK